MNTPWTTRLTAAACAVSTATLIFAAVVGLAWLPGDTGVVPAGPAPAVVVAQA
jgi:hypothetical protein